MASICLCFDGRDEALAKRLTSFLQAREATVLSEPEIDRNRPEIERADGVAARVKAADVVAVIAGSDPESMAQAMRALRAARAYGRSTVVGRLDPQVALDAAMADDGDAQSARLRSFDLYAPMGSGGGTGEEGEHIEAGDGINVPTTAAFTSFVLQVAEREAQANGGSAAGAGGPETPLEMLERWRRIEERGDVAEMERFLSDYSEDPYFSIRAAGAIRSARRRASRRRAAFGYHATMAALLVVGLVGFGIQFCGWGGCSIGGGLDNIQALSSFTSSDPDPREAATEPRGREVASLASPREADVDRAVAAEERAELRAVEDAAAEAEGALDAAQREIEELREDRDQLRSDLAEANADRDRLEASAKEMQEELEALRSEAAGPAPDAAVPSADLERLEQELAVAEADLRDSRAEADRLRASLAEAEAENEALLASAERDRQAPPRAAAAISGGPAMTAAPAAPSAPRADAPPPRAADIAPAPRPRAAQRSVRRSENRRRTARTSRRSGAAQRGGPNVALRRYDPNLRRAPIDPDAADPRAVGKVLSAMREEMRSVATSRGADVRRVQPYLTPNGVRLVQRCLRRGAGANVSTDGVWGRRTTAALLSVRGAEGAKVASCLKGRLRRN